MCFGEAPHHKQLQYCPYKHYAHLVHIYRNYTLNFQPWQSVHWLFYLLCTLRGVSGNCRRQITQDVLCPRLRPLGLKELCPDISLRKKKRFCVILDWSPQSNFAFFGASLTICCWWSRHLRDTNCRCPAVAKRSSTLSKLARTKCPKVLLLLRWKSNIRCTVADKMLTWGNSDACQRLHHSDSDEGCLHTDPVIPEAMRWEPRQPIRLNGERERHKNGPLKCDDKPTWQFEARRW